MKYWGYDDVDGWWHDGEEAQEDEDKSPHQLGSSNRVSGEELESTAPRGAPSGTPTAAEVKSDEISTVVVAVASRRQCYM